MAGDFVDGEDTKDNLSPVDKTSLGKVHRASLQQVDNAVNKAYEVFPKWKNLDARKRGNILLKIAEQALKNLVKIFSI